MLLEQLGRKNHLRVVLLTTPRLLKPHFHHLLREESLMGFRGKFQTEPSDSHTASIPCHPFCYVTQAAMCTVTQEVKVCCPQ